MKNIYLKGGLNKNLIFKLNYYFKNQINLRTEALNILTFKKLPDWYFFDIPFINYNKLFYFSEPIYKIKPSLYNIILKSVDIIFNSSSINISLRYFLNKQGIIYLSIFKSIKFYYKLYVKYINTWIKIKDNFFITINSTIFSEGSFWYILKNLFWIFELNTYFIAHIENFAQFEKTLIVLNKNSKLLYLEGCTAPSYIESQLHIASVEIILKFNSKINYTTIQNWYRGNILNEGGVYNYTTKRGLVLNKSLINWTQVEVGSFSTWKYPSSVLLGYNSISVSISLTFSSNNQSIDTGFKVYHLNNNTKSTVISKSMSMNISVNIFRFLLFSSFKLKNIFSYIECSSILIGLNSLIGTIPYINIKNKSIYIEQETFISKINIQQLFIFLQRNIWIKLAYNIILLKFFISLYNFIINADILNELSYLLFLRIEECIL